MNWSSKWEFVSSSIWTLESVRFCKPSRRSPAIQYSAAVEAFNFIMWKRQSWKTGEKRLQKCCFCYTCRCKHPLEIEVQGSWQGGLGRDTGKLLRRSCFSKTAKTVSVCIKDGKNEKWNTRLIYNTSSWNELDLKRSWRMMRLGHPWPHTWMCVEVLHLQMHPNYKTNTSASRHWESGVQLQLPDLSEILGDAHEASWQKAETEASKLWENSV